jgi:hypothetical protein
MTSFAQNLATIGWSIEEFARHIGCNERLAELMVTGDADVPPEVADWVQALAIFFVNHPAPRWKGFRQDSSFLRNPSQRIFAPFKINGLPKGILIEDSLPRKV